MRQILARHGVIEGSDDFRHLLAARQLPKACVDEILSETLSFFDFVGWDTRDRWIKALDIHARLVWYVLDGGSADPEKEALAEPMRALLFRHGVSFVER